MRDVTVIGGSGFIGAALVQLLAGANAAVRVLSRSGKSPWGACANVQTLRGDVGNPEDVSAAIEGASVVYHLAAGGGNQWEDFERTIVRGTRYVAEACLRQGVERLVYTSSIAALYLGQRRRIDERTGPDPLAVKRSYYSRAKSLAEELLKDLHRTAGLPVVVVRPGVVVGPNGMLNHSGLGTWGSDTCCLGWGRGTNPLPFVLVGDVAQALVNCMQAPGIEGMTFNLVGDLRPTAAEFINLLRARSRRNFRFYPQSLWKMQGIEIGKWALKTLAHKPGNLFPSYRDLMSRTLRSQFDCSAAKDKLGWRPVQSMDAFIVDAIDSHLRPLSPKDLRRECMPV